MTSRENSWKPLARIFADTVVQDVVGEKSDVVALSCESTAEEALQVIPQIRDQQRKRNTFSIYQVAKSVVLIFACR
jgi:methylmalonyl-CoA mutase cobalamin-binding subunit